MARSIQHKMKNNNFCKIDKEKSFCFLAGLALFICVISSGGLNWQNCLLPLFVLTSAILFLNKTRQIKHSLPMILLLCLSFFSVFISMINPQTSIYEAYKFMCFIAAVAIGYLMKNDKDILKIIFFNALIVAVFGILACCRIISFEEFTFKDNSYVRLQSFIKYANVTACFLGCGYISFLKLFAENKKPIYLYGGFCILTALYFTFSKACIPIFLIVCIFYIYKERQLGKIFFMQNIISAVLLIFMLITTRQNLHFLLFVLIAAGVLISGRINKNNEKYFYACVSFLAFLILACVIAVILKPSLAGTFVKRIEYMKDALKLIPNNPLFGSGFGSWRVLQYKVQTKQYDVTYLHNGLLQMIVENGLIFTTAFLCVVIYALVNAIKSKKYHFASIILIILIHSLIDCDLSFGVILLVLGITVGKELPESNIKIYNQIANYLLVILLCFINLYMAAEYTLRYSFEKAYIENNYTIAADKANKLEILCPFDAQLKINQAAIEEKTTNNTSLIQKKLKEAIKLSASDPEIFENYMNYELKNENIEKMCLKYVEMAPKQERTYAFLKQYLKDANKNKFISDETYSLIYDKIENRRIKEKVIDRNELLNKLVNE